jgi:predicted permease
MATLLQDLKFGVRLLTRHPAMTAVVVLSLALGIGANTTIFTLVKAVLLNPLAAREPSRLVRVVTTELRDGVVQPLGGISRINAVDMAEKNGVFDGVGIAGFAPMALSSSGGEPEQVFGQIASGNFFEVLGPPMAAGRTFRADEDQTPGASPVVVLTYGLWQRRFGGDPRLVGQSITLNGRPFSVIGVTGEGFRGTATIGGPELWVPLSMYREILSGQNIDFFNSRRALFYESVGRLKPGVTLQQAQANVEAIGKGLEEAYPTEFRGRSLRVRPLTEGTFPPQFQQQLVLAGTLMMAVVGLVLLIACANVANLLLARATARRQEIAVRLSIGANRGRLVRQLLTESVLLAALGGLGGIVVAYWARAAIWSYRPVFLQPGVMDLDLDGRVLLFTAAVSVLTGVIFGLAPALQGSRADLVTELKDRTSAPSGSRLISAKNVLVMAQVTLSFVALAAAGLFLRSLMNAQRIDTGFDGSRFAIMAINPGTQGYDEARTRELYRRVEERLSGVAGVEAVTLSSSVPLFGGGIARTVFRDGQDAKDPRNGRMAQVNQVSGTYFYTTKIPIVKGRAITAADRQGGTPVVVVNETMAAQFWPNEDPVGHTVQIFGIDTPWQVVGVARTIKYNFIGEEPIAYMYLPLEQNHGSQVVVQVRASGDPSPVLGTVRRELQQMEPTMPLLNVSTYDTVIQQALWAPRMAASLLAIFAGLALLLAAVGLYGVLAYSVTQRTRELGIRMALGARDTDVRGMVVRQGVVLAVAGLVPGLLVSWLLSRAITRLLYGVNAGDTVTFVIVPVLLMVVAMLATLLPAWRASKVDPAEALRV